MLVEHYLAQGTPVASKTLATQPGIDVSPATVRSIMAELEARGLVVSPHTSAGKIPTNLGLRFFVDTLLSVQPLGRSSVQMLRDGLNPDLAPSRLVELASGLLAEISSMAGVVTLPRKEQVLLRQVEFLPLTANRVLVILVINERDVQNRVIHTDREYSESELVHAANYINREFAGASLMSIRTALVESMQRDKASVDQMMQMTLDMASKAFEVGCRVRAGCGRLHRHRRDESAEHAERCRSDAPAVRCVLAQARHPAPARPVSRFGGHPALHRRRVRLRSARRL